jgi:hypothetical protein
MKIRNAVALFAGGPGSGRHKEDGTDPGVAVVDKKWRPNNEFDTESRMQIHNHLMNNGFKTSSVNTDPKKDLVTYSKNDWNHMTGKNVTHHVAVEPNGHWTHSIEVSRKGSGVGGLQDLTKRAEDMAAAAKALHDAMRVTRRRHTRW